MVEENSSVRDFDLDGGRIQLHIHSVEVFRGQLLGSGVDHTGVMIWPATHLMVDWLLEHRQELEGLTVVELGAGAGLCGILASRLGTANVIITDRDDDSLDLIRRNIEANRPTEPCGEIQAARLPWGDEECMVALSAQSVDMVIGSDILYPSIPQEVVDLLFSTARRLLRPRGRLVLSFIARDGKQTLRAMLHSAKRERFSLEKMLNGSDVRGCRPESTSLGARIFVFSSAEGSSTCEAVEEGAVFDQAVDRLLPGVWQDPEPRSDDSEEEWEAPFADEEEEEEGEGK